MLAPQSLIESLANEIADKVIKSTNLRFLLIGMNVIYPNSVEEILQRACKKILDTKGYPLVVPKSFQAKRVKAMKGDN